MWRPYDLSFALSISLSNLALHFISFRFVMIFFKFRMCWIFFLFCQIAFPSRTRDRNGDGELFWADKTIESSEKKYVVFSLIFYNTSFDSIDSQAYMDIDLTRHNPVCSLFYCFSYHFWGFFAPQLCCALLLSIELSWAKRKEPKKERDYIKFIVWMNFDPTSR